MQEEYSWNGIEGGSSSFRLPRNEGHGKWVFAAIVFAILAHVGILLGLKEISITLAEEEEGTQIRTEVIRVSPVDTKDSRPEINPPDRPEIMEPVPVVPPADELEILENLPEMEMDISPEIETIQVPNISAAAIGELEGESKEPMKALVFDPDLPEMGKTEDFFPRADDSQVSVDPGARMSEEYDPDAYSEALRKGAGGNAEDGLLKEFTSLDQMAHMDGNSLVTTKALIGSDLLFEFNSAELKQSARVSLMKVAMLIHKHPKLVCWLDGHTDLIGGEEPNLRLSRARALAVRSWLVDSMDLSAKRIAVRGFGKTQPLVKGGSVEQQAPNRRVEIKMRKNHPAAQPKTLPKPRAKPRQPEKPKPTTVPAFTELPVIPQPPSPPKAIVELEEEPQASRAEVIPEDEPQPPVPRRAIPVEE